MRRLRGRRERITDASDTNIKAISVIIFFSSYLIVDFLASPNLYSTPFFGVIGGISFIYGDTDVLFLVVRRLSRSVVSKQIHVEVGHISYRTFGRYTLQNCYILYPLNIRNRTV